MSGAGVVAIVLVVFFAVGIAVGIVIVIAWPARRADKADRRNRRPGTPAADSGYFDDDEPDHEPDPESPWWQTRRDA